MVSNNCNTAPMPLAQPGASRPKRTELTEVAELEETELTDMVPLDASGNNLHIQNELNNISEPGDFFHADDMSGSGGERMSVELDDMQDIIDFNNLKPISSPDPQQNTRGYREIVLGVADKDEQDMFLKLRDEKHTWNNLYLGRSRTFKNGESPKHWNMVVPIIPRCYTTPDRSPVHADIPRKGWLYIIRKCTAPNGQEIVELWRELESDGLGNFRDVQLKYQRGNDHRPGTGQWGFRVIVPYQINNVPHELWIAFSEVQWSWARIEKMKSIPDSALRDQRMQKLDVSACLNNFDGYAPAPSEDKNRDDDDYHTTISDAPDTALIHRLDLATDENSKNLRKVSRIRFRLCIWMTQ